MVVATCKKSPNMQKISVKTNILYLSMRLILLVSILSVIHATPVTLYHRKRDETDYVGKLNYFLPNGFDGACGTPILNSALAVSVVSRIYIASSFMNVFALSLLVFLKAFQTQMKRLCVGPVWKYLTQTVTGLL